MPLSDIFPDEKRIDLRGVPSNNRILIREWEDLGLEEITSTEKVAHGPCFSHIIESIPMQLLRIMEEVPRNFVSIEIGSVG